MKLKLFGLLLIALACEAFGQSAVSILQEFDAKLSLDGTKQLESQSRQQMIPRTLQKQWRAFLKTQGARAEAFQKSPRLKNTASRARRTYIERVRICKPRRRSDAWVARAQLKFPREFLDHHQRHFRRMIFYIARQRERECEG